MNRVLALTVLGLFAVVWTGCDRRPSDPNVVLIVLDTVRSDYTGVAGRTPSPTPVLDELAAEGTVFTDVWANAPWTVPSHASIFSGLLPSGHRCTGYSNRFESERPTFAELLGEAGYETVAFYSNPWLTDKLTGMLRGFEQHCAEPEDRTDIFNRGDQGGPKTLANVGSWLEGRDRSRPFLLFANFLEPHLPYDPTDAYRREYLADLPPDAVFRTERALAFNARLLAPEDIDFGTASRLYAGDVHSADEYLGQLISMVRDHVGDDETIIIVTSDHGENIGDHGYMDHQFGVFGTLIEVPLVVSARGRLPVGARDDPVMLSDIYDTILDFAGVEGGPITPHSRSLLEPPAHPDRPLIAEYAGANPSLLRALRRLNPDYDTSRAELAFSKIRFGSWEYTVASDGSEALYDLESDSAREHNVAGDRPEVTSLMLELMPGVSSAVGEQFEVDEEMREWLKSLGYVQ